MTPTLYLAIVFAVIFIFVYLSEWLAVSLLLGLLLVTGCCDSRLSQYEIDVAAQRQIEHTTDCKKIIKNLGASNGYSTRYNCSMTVKNRPFGVTFSRDETQVIARYLLILKQTKGSPRGED